MELKDFISQTLVQIAEGVIEANENLDAKGGKVNPSDVIINYDPNSNVYGVINSSNADSHLIPVNKIDFDVEVTATSGSETKGGIKIGLGNIGLGSEGKSGKENQASNRIKFTIPMLLPNAPK